MTDAVEKKCIKCGKVLPSVHPDRAEAEGLVCFECFLKTDTGKDKLHEPYNPPIGGGAGRSLGGRHIDGVEIHHSASDSGNAASFRYYHSVVLGWGDIAYQRVITNGQGGPDGEIQFGKSDDLYPFGVGDYAIDSTKLAVCLVGNFSPGRYPTPAQRAPLVDLTRSWARIYALDSGRIRGHRQWNANSACPGFEDSYITDIANSVFSGKERDVSITFPDPYLVDSKWYQAGVKWRIPWVDASLAKTWIHIDVPVGVAAQAATAYFAGKSKTLTLAPGETKQITPGDLGNSVGPVEIVFDKGGANVSLSYIYPK